MRLYDVEDSAQSLNLGTGENTSTTNNFEGFKI
jgi:hypothetical protein